MSLIKKQVYTIQEVSTVLGVSQDTVRRLIQRGVLQRVTLPVSRVLILKDSVDRVLRNDREEGSDDAFDAD